MRIHRFVAFHIAAVSTAVVIVPLPAIAEEAAPVAATDDEARPASATPEPARLLPGVVAARAGAPVGAGFGWGGYDSATDTPVMGIAFEVRLGTRVVIGASAIYAAATDLEPAKARPSVQARVQILDQASHGIDLGVAVAYHQDRFTQEEGLIQGGLALGWHDDVNALLVNLAYGRDGEGDDQQGEVRIVGFRRLVGELHLGLDGRVRGLIASTDQFREQHHTPTVECTVAPALTYTMGPLTLMVEAGWSAVRIHDFQSGVLALGGVGAAF